MTGGTFTTAIDAPIERVWAVVGDLNTHASWSPKPYEMEWTSGEPNKVGSRLHSVGSVPGASHNQNDTEITERVEPTRLVLRANDPQGVFVNEYDLRAIDDRTTEVAYTITFPKLHGAAAVLGPVLFPLVGKPDIRKRLEMLKRKVDHETQP